MMDIRTGSADTKNIRWYTHSIIVAIILFAILMTLALSGCNAKSDDDNDRVKENEGASEAEKQEEQNNDENNDKDESSAGDAKRTLVIYFGRTGNTDFSGDVDASTSASIVKGGSDPVGNAEQMAIWIAEEIGCETYEVTVKDKYPADYNETVDQAKEEQNKDVRPALTGEIEGFQDIDTFYLVFPNWWADLPMPLYTFLDDYDFSGKTINVFITHGGSGFSSTVDTIKTLEPEADVNEGIDVYASDVPDSKEDIIDWIKQNG